MFRLYFGIFWGKNTKYEHTPHESPLSMTFPLMVLAFLSIATGYTHFSEYVSPDKMGFETHLDVKLAIVATSVGLIGIALAAVFYFKPNNLSDRFAHAFGSFYKWTYDKFYFDEIYLFVTRNILFKGVAASAAWFDRNVVDASMNLIGNSTVLASQKIKKLQSGRFQDYAFAFVGGAVVLALVFIYLWTN